MRPFLAFRIRFPFCYSVPFNGRGPGWLYESAALSYRPCSPTVWSYPYEQGHTSRTESSRAVRAARARAAGTYAATARMAATGVLRVRSFRHEYIYRSGMG